MGFDSKCDFVPPAVLLGLLPILGCGVSPQRHTSTTQPPHWERGILATGPPGLSPRVFWVAHMFLRWRGHAQTWKTDRAEWQLSYLLPQAGFWWRHDTHWHMRSAQMACPGRWDWIARGGVPVFCPTLPLPWEETPARLVELCPWALASSPSVSLAGQGPSSPKVSLYLVYSAPSSFLSFRTFFIIIPLSPWGLKPRPSQPLLNVQDGFSKGRGTRDQIANICWIIENARVPEKHLHWLCQSLSLCGSQQTVENSSRDGNTKPPELLPEKSMQVKKQQLELDIEQQTISESGKE